jgi:hypothetical protein
MEIGNIDGALALLEVPIITFHFYAILFDKFESSANEKSYEANEVGTGSESRQRAPTRCGHCNGAGHTRRTCPCLRDHPELQLETGKSTYLEITQN